MLVMTLLMHVVFIFTAVQCPLNPFRFEAAGDKTASIFLFIFYPLAQASIMSGLFYLSSFVLRSLLPNDQGKSAQVTLAIFAFIVSFLQVLLKNLKPEFGFIGALLYPIFMFFPLGFTIRDTNASMNEFKQKLLNDLLDEVTLVHMYKIYKLFKVYKGLLVGFFLSSIILGTFVAILPEGLWQMALTTLMLTQFVFLAAIALAFLPSRWMNVEIKIKNTMVVKEVYKIRGTAPENQNLLDGQVQV